MQQAEVRNFFRKSLFLQQVESKTDGNLIRALTGGANGYWEHRKRKMLREAVRHISSMPKHLISSSAPSKTTVRPRRCLQVPGIQLSPPKQVAFIIPVTARWILWGSLGPWALISISDVTEQRSRRNITDFGLRGLTATTPEVLTFDLAMPGSVPTMNSHTGNPAADEAEEGCYLNAMAAKFHTLWRGYSIFTDKWIFEWIIERSIFITREHYSKKGIWKYLATYLGCYTLHLAVRLSGPFWQGNPESGQPHANQQTQTGSQLQSLPPEGSSAHRHNGTSPLGEEKTEDTRRASNAPKIHSEYSTDQAQNRLPSPQPTHLHLPPTT